jgi:hypothetical protein
MALIRILMPIACPNGFNTANGKRQVSVYFSPRILSIPAPGTFGSMPDWSNWPNALGSITVEFTTNLGLVNAANVTQISSPSSSRWAAVFAADTPVTGYSANDYRGTPFLNFPEGAVAADIMALYRDVAVNVPLDPPSAADLLSRAATSEVLSSGQLAADLAAARAYQRRLGNLPNSSPAGPTWDFHQAISLLGRHPALMRMLGLVVDYELPSAGTVNWIAASSDWAGVFAPAPASGNTIKEVSPRVMVDADFLPRTNPAWANANSPRTGSSKGFLALANGPYQLSSLDVTTAVQRLGALARELAGDSATGSLPALTDSGLNLLRSDRSADVAAQFADDWRVETEIATFIAQNDTPPQLWAENLRVGYRVDTRRPLVSGGSEPPRSLFARRSTGYVFPANVSLNTTPDPDEGWVGTSYSTDLVQGGGAASTNRLPSSLARWRGWGLAIQPHGTVVDTKNQTATTTDSNALRAGDKVRFTTEYEASPGTLPRLLYGQTYLMRARNVDITGNSVPLSATAPASAPTDNAVYGRLDPLPPPVVVRRSAKPVPGVADRVDRIVIKSNYDTPPAAIPGNDRLVFPPATSQATCERHGFPNGGASGATGDYSLLEVRDGLDPSDQCVVDPTTGEVVAGVLDSGAVTAGPTTQAAAYLPEPAGPTLSMRNVPGAAGQLLAAFTGSWPSWNARRLVVETALAVAQPAPVVDATGVDVTIKLPKAAQGLIELSVAPGELLATHFAIMHEILAANPGNLALLKAYVENGRHWMVSSRRKVLVVHAVRQPLSIPSFASLTADRPGIGSHRFELTGVANLNRPSTGRTILTGTWTDPVDDVTQPEPGVRSGTMLVGTQKVALGGAATTADVALENRFPDARRHQLLLRQEAYTRFARDFTEQQTLTFNGANPTRTLSALGVLAASVKLSSDDTTYTEGSDYTLDAAAGKVTRIDGGGLADDAPVIALYVALPLSRFSDETGAADFQVTVPNAKTPAPLPVHSVIPSFRRSFRKKRAKITAVTDPRVVRVYLERPWYDTGTGELLGVVLDRAAGVLPAVPPHTRFARDSILAVGDVPRPRIQQFTGAVPGVSDGFRVAGYPVTFDAARKQWYADVSINADLGYRAFVQLGLARYQPEAIAGAGLSRINQQDPVLLGTPRAVVVSRKATKLQVSVKGVDHEGRKVGRKKNLFNKVTVDVQGVDRKVRDPELRWSERPLGQDELELTRKAGKRATTWKGSLAASDVAQGKKLRLVITEWEPMSGTNDAGTREVLEYRPVFTEVVQLPKSWTKRR